MDAATVAAIKVLLWTAGIIAVLYFLFGKRRKSAKGSTAMDLGTPAGDCDFHIVSESRYQAQLHNLARKGRTFKALLIPEPRNEFDPNAIMVCTLTGNKLGYFARGDAFEYHDVFKELAKLGHVGACDAKLIGGTDDKPHLGVLLNLRNAEEMLARIRDPKIQTVEGTLP